MKYNQTLKKYFGFDNFRDKQLDIINAIIKDGRDVCAIMFTGAGKSLCYQFPAIHTDKIVIVISPLISLMDDQIMKLDELDIPAICLNSTVKNKPAVKKSIILGEYNVVYMTPEYLVTQESFFETLSETDLLLAVFIDESHCVSTWGNDFRESYKRLGCIRDWLPDTPIVALTATATEKVQNDIIKVLQLKKPLLIKTSFDRPNLKICVSKKSGSALNDIHPFIKNGDRTIIYCQTRKMTDELTELFQNHNIECGGYHAGMEDGERKRIHIAFTEGELTCIIATVAFGMGIDTNIKNVIHYGIPKDLESYYQEIGRAGRSGEAATCQIFYDLKDNNTNDYFINQIINPNYRKHRIEIANTMKKYIFLQECRRKFILNYFGEEYQKDNCDNCDNCLNENKDIIKKDFTKEILLFLQTVDKFNGDYGCGTIIDIIRGSKAKKITCQMKKFKTYGQGGDKSVNWWKILARIITNHELVREKSITGGHGFTIKISTEGKKWLTDEGRKKMIFNVPEEMKI